MSVKYGCYVRTNGQPPCCRLCEKPLEIGEGYARIYINSYADPHFHSHCLKPVINRIEFEQARVDVYKEEHAKEEAIRAAARAKGKAATRANNERIKLRVKIIKDALKSADIKVSKLSITCGWAGGLDGAKKYKLAKRRRFRRSGPVRSCAGGDGGRKDYYSEPAFMWVHIKGHDVVIQPGEGIPGHIPRDWDTYNKFCLADPESIPKMGAAMLKIGADVWKPYLKKPRKK